MRAALTHAAEALLLRDARRWAGSTLGELAQALQLALPDAPERHKGFGGRLLERALLASAPASSVQDFPALGIELKTLPVDRQGRPRESTFVCHVDLSAICDVPWPDSRVRHKLSRVLFVPIETDRALAYAARRVGSAWLWSPSAEQQALLRDDYSEIAGRIGRGEIETLSAHVGRVLQLRPKGANSRVRTRVLDADGASSRALPRAFYLRATFTRTLLQAALL